MSSQETSLQWALDNPSDFILWLDVLGIAQKKSDQGIEKISIEAFMQETNEGDRERVEGILQRLCDRGLLRKLTEEGGEGFYQYRKPYILDHRDSFLLETESERKIRELFEKEREEAYQRGLEDGKKSALSLKEET